MNTSNWMNPVRYLSGEDILVIHSRIVEQIGGSHGVRDTGLLASIVDAPTQQAFGKELYADIFAKAAVYLERTANYHVFVDGNKRTSIAAAARFLYLNGYTLRATNDEVEFFVLRVVVEKLPLEEIAGWLKKHSRKIMVQKQRKKRS